MTARSVGYARCSTASQKTDAQVAALKEAGCAVVFEETISTRVKEKDRPQLQAALSAVVEGDELVVAKVPAHSTVHSFLNQLAWQILQCTRF